MARVLLTGATGFIGRRVLASLTGHDVLCASRHPEAVPTGPGVRAMAADLGESGPWVAEIERFAPDWCMHLAWEGLPDYSLDRCRRNLDAGLRLIDVVSRAGVRRMLVAGSCWEYGDASGKVAENLEIRRAGVFAATKLGLQTIFESVARTAGFDCVWARVFFVYGPGQRPTSLLPSLRAAYTSGRVPEIREPAAVQDFVHIDDVAEALVALTASNAGSGVFNVGSGHATQVGEVANIVADYYGRPRPFATLATPRGFWADTDKISSAIGWRPRLDIHAGIRQTLAAWDEQA